jgi:hypothetical protein
MQQYLNRSPISDDPNYPIDTTPTEPTDGTGGGGGGGNDIAPVASTEVSSPAHNTGVSGSTFLMDASDTKVFLAGTYTVYPGHGVSVAWQIVNRPNNSDGSLSGNFETYDKSIAGVPVDQVTLENIAAAGDYLVEFGVTDLVSGLSDARFVTITKPQAATEAAVITFPELSARSVGNTVALFASSTNSVTPLSFASSDPSVAAVSSTSTGDWRLTAVGPGLAYITASQAAGNGFMEAQPVVRVQQVGVGTPTGDNPVVTTPQPGPDTTGGLVKTPSFPGQVLSFPDIQCFIRTKENRLGGKQAFAATTTDPHTVADALPTSQRYRILVRARRPNPTVLSQPDDSYALPNVALFSGADQVLNPVYMKLVKRLADNSSEDPRVSLGLKWVKTGLINYSADLNADFSPVQLQIDCVPVRLDTGQPVALESSSYYDVVISPELLFEWYTP